MTYKQLVEHYVNSSTMELIIERDREGWRRIRIIIQGELEVLPILKNTKQMAVVKGRPIITSNKDTKAKISALDILYRRHKSKIEQYDGLSVVVVLMSVKQRADRVSVQETIQDWLEPHDKAVGRQKSKSRERGWGVGIYKSDKDAIGMCFRQSDISYFWEGAEIWVMKERGLMSGAFSHFRESFDD
jgi:hypothetical protein